MVSSDYSRNVVGNFLLEALKLELSGIFLFGDEILFNRHQFRPHFFPPSRTLSILLLFARSAAPFLV